MTIRRWPGRRIMTAALIGTLASLFLTPPAPASPGVGVGVDAAQISGAAQTEAAQTQGAQTEGFVHGTADADAVPGRYIVMFRHRGAGRQATAAAAQAFAGNGVSTVFGSGLAGFSARLTAVAARRLAADPSVALVEQDRVVRLSRTQRKPRWSLDRIDQRGRSLSRTYRPTSAAGGVHAYVIDTGIRLAHHEFGGRATYGYDFVDGDRFAGDCDGHGTHVAGTLGGTRYGVAKRVRLVAVRVLDCNGEGYLSDIIAGVDWVTTNAVKPAVANMSLGGDQSYALEYAVQDSIASGVTYTVAAGNESENACLGSPSGLGAAITVGASDSKDRRAYFSDYGSCVDLFAPGVKITSAVSRSNTATATWDGTSMAAPQVAGAAAMVLAAHPGYSPARVRRLLVARSTKGKIVNKGTGSPNRLLYTPPPPVASSISTRKVTAGTAGRTYRTQLKLGSTRRGSWKLSGGRLPAGLHLSAAGVISGTPAAAGSRRFTVRFTDWVPQSVTRTLTVSVKARPPVISTSTLPPAVYVQD